MYDVSKRVVCAVAIALIVGCAGTSGKTVGSALGRATGGVVGHQMGETGLGSQVGSDLGGVAGSTLDRRKTSRKAPASEQEPETKFCPVGGERFPATFKHCPTHGVELRELTPQ